MRALSAKTYTLPATNPLSWKFLPKEIMSPFTIPLILVVSPKR